MGVMVTARVSSIFAVLSIGFAASSAWAQTASPPSSPAAATQAAAPEATDKKANEEATGDTPAVVVDDNKVENLLGKDVTSAKGEKLGQITDILVSHSGEVRAAVIDFGGFLGVGSRKIAVAWGTLQFSPNAITLRMTRDELRVTPEYHQGEPIVIVGAAMAAGQPSSSVQPSPALPPPADSSAPAK